MMRTVALALAALAVCIAAYLVAPHATSTFDGSVQARRVPPLAFVDDRGAPLTLNARPRGALVVLGYTRCTDDCPLTLAKVAAALRTMHGTRADAYFVTVDPAFDRPAVLHRYLATWNHAVAGVTGNPDHLRRLVLALDAGDPARASQDHDGRMFAIDRDGEVVTDLPPSAAPDEIAATLRSLAR